MFLSFQFKPKVCSLEDEAEREKQEFEDAYIQNDVEVETLSEHVMALERMLSNELHEVTSVIEDKAKQMHRYGNDEGRLCLLPILLLMVYVVGKIDKSRCSRTRGRTCCLCQGTGVGMIFQADFWSLLDDQRVSRLSR